MAIEIIATGHAVPSNRVTNDDLAARIDTSDEWIRSHTGIGARHIADEKTATSDLALAAARSALATVAERDGTSVEEAAATLDIIVVATVTPDYLSCPSTACIVQAALGATKAGALDIEAGCTGFVYALDTAAGIITMGAKRKRALVVGADTLTRIANWDDRSTCVLFGDGAGCAIIEKTSAPSEGEGRRGLIRSILGADGTGAEHLIIRKGGSREPFKKGDVLERAPWLEMNGQAVYNFAVKAVTDTIQQLLADDGIEIGQVKRIIPHQANARIVAAAGKRLGIAPETFFMNMEEYANTSAASIPIALDELARSGGLSKGDIILTVGFGAGLTYAGNIIVW